MLYVIHDEAVPVPARLHGSTRLVQDRLALFDLTRDDVLIWGNAPPTLTLEELPPGRLLLSLSASVVRRGREFGWPGALLLPDLAPSTLEAALSPDPALIPLGDRTLAPDRGELWSEDGITRLGRRERLLLEHLAAARGALVSRGALCAALDATGVAIDGAIRRLRAKIGADQIVCERGSGWRLRSAPAPAVALAPAAPPLRWGTLVLEEPGQRLWVDDRPVALGSRETEALALLFRARGAPTGRARIAEALAGLSGSGVDTLMHRLRKKLGREHLITVRGAGWRLAGEAERTPPAPPALDAARLGALLERHALVTVIGLPGAGTSQLLSEASQQLRVPMFDVSGDLERGLRWAARHPDRVAVLDGVDDARTHQAILSARLAAGQRVLLGARAPAELPHEHVVTLPAPRVPDPDRVRRALDGLPDAAGALTALSLFSASFSADDVRAVAGPGVDPEALARRHLLQRRSGRYAIPPVVRDALPHRPDRDAAARWAQQVVCVAEATLHARPSRCSELVRLLPDLDAALSWLTTSGDPQAARAAVLWYHVSRLAGGPIDGGRLAALRHRPLPQRQRAELLLALAECEETGAGAAIQLLEEVLQLEAAPGIHWMARAVLLNRRNDLDPAGRRERTAALIQQMDQAAHPPPPDVRALVDLVWSMWSDAPLETRRVQLAEAVARIERARWVHRSGIEVWNQNARACLLSELGQLYLRLGDLDAADEALEEAQALGAPDAIGLARFRAAVVLARRGAWAEADTALERLAFAPIHQHRPLHRGRILACRGLLAAIHGERALAASLADQTEWLAAKVGIQGLARSSLRIRAWLAAADGDAERAEALARASWPAGAHAVEALVAVARYLATGQPSGEALAELLDRSAGDDALGRTEGLRALLRAHSGRGSPQTHG